MTAYDRARNIRIAIFDVDGVLTDGRLWYSGAGESVKSFDVRDGLGLKLLRDAGVIVAVMTSRNSPSVASRAGELGIDHLLQGVHDKGAALDRLLAERQLAPDTAAFLGDDLVDLPALARCGFAVTVAGAPAVLKRCAHHVTQHRGGRGAAREFCEFIAHARGALRVHTVRYRAGAGS